MHACLCNQCGNMHAFVLCTRLNVNVDTGAVFLWYNLYVLGRITPLANAVAPDIERTRKRYVLYAGNLRQKAFDNIIQHYSAPP